MHSVGFEHVLKSVNSESYAIVGCGENPNYQVWGARSDLACGREKKPKMLTMKFGDWVKKRDKRDGRQKD